MGLVEYIIPQKARTVSGIFSWYFSCQLGDKLNATYQAHLLWEAKTTIDVCDCFRVWWYVPPPWGLSNNHHLKTAKKKKMKVLNLRGLRAGFYVATPLCFRGDFFFVRWILESTLFRTMPTSTMSAETWNHVPPPVRKPITEPFFKHGWSTYPPQATYSPQKYGFHTALFKGNQWLSQAHVVRPAIPGGVTFRGGVGWLAVL